MLRLLPELDADGPTQMAYDEALLESAATATLRLYTWTPPTVSLGYFQDHDAIAAQLPPGMPVVRRITGGGAIWHEHEVTYCLIGVLGQDGFPERVRDLYPLLHGAVLAGLRRQGAILERQAATIGDRRYREEPRCFASPALDDLVHTAGGKALGSAGRARGRRVLVHGSLKLASNPWDGPAAAGCGLERTAAAAVLRTALGSALGLMAEPGTVSAAEAIAMRRIREERYGSPRWVRERLGPAA
jgi:lipoate-protein ligase A